MQTVLFCLCNLVVMWGIAVAVGRWLKLSQEERAGLTLVSIFTNSVNYGLPLVLLAFGQLGLDKASVYVILQMILGNTLGIYFAARSHFTMAMAVKQVLGQPAVYAAVLAVLARVFEVKVPEGIAEASP